MAIGKKKETLDDLKERVEALEHDLQAAKDGLAFHENRLNNLSLPEETVNTLSLRGIRTLAQLLLAATSPQQPVAQGETTPEPIAKEA